jgi:TatD DNase family protein
MRYFDTHCHLDFDCFNSELDSLLWLCGQKGIDKVLVPATCGEVFSSLLQMPEIYKGVYIALGIHPFFITGKTEGELLDLRRLLAQRSSGSRVRAIGEFGLDKSCAVDYDLQLAVATSQFEMAAEFNLPVVLHNRKSDQALLNLIDKYRISKGVIHGFSGSYEIGMEFIKRGFYLGVGGVITWTNANKVRRSISRLPIESLVLETDAPDMSPQWLKGKRNTPLTVIGVSKLLADIKGCSQATVVDATYLNSCRLFGVSSN